MHELFPYIEQFRFEHHRQENEQIRKILQKMMLDLINWGLEQEDISHEPLVSVVTFTHIVGVHKDVFRQEPYWSKFKTFEEFQMFMNEE